VAPAKTLICGATGRVGGATLDAIVSAGHEAMALARTPDRAKALPGDIEVRVADFADVAALESAFAGVDALLLCSAHGPEMAVGQLNAVAAAERAGVQRVVKISASPASIFPGTPAEAAAQHLEVEEALRATSLSAVCIRPNAYMQTLAAFAPAIRGGQLPLALGSAPVSWMDVQDVGALSALALTSDSLNEQIIEATGPEGLTGEDAAAALSDALAIEVVYRPISEESAREAMLETGMSAWFVDHVLTVFRLLRERGGGDVSDAVPRLLGRPATTLAGVAKRDAHLFAA
jgi:uncharacterized protein YbjT (DUF2867 family)